MSNEPIKRSEKGNAAILTLDRQEKRNAMNHDMIEGLAGAFEELRGNSSIRVVCLTGAGDKYFCAGADLGSVGGGEAKSPMDTMRMYAEILKTMVRYPKPIVCRLNGHVMGGGVGLMLASDIVIARSDVTVATPEVNVGIFPMMIGVLIYRNALLKKAMKMMLLGERISAAAAESMGMVSMVAEPEAFDREVDAVIEGLAGKSPLALALGKEYFHTMTDMDFDQALYHLCQGLSRVVQTEDAMEGFMAFMEKRKPVFKGK
jgi:enoyl-CoA hydratase/carnithine racemase